MRVSRHLHQRSNVEDAKPAKTENTGKNMQITRDIIEALAPFKARLKQLFSDDPLELAKGMHSIMASIRVAIDPVNEDFDGWLRQLHGKKFPRETAYEKIEIIKRSTEIAGRELLYEGKCVTVYCNLQQTRRHASIRVYTLGVMPQKALYNRTAFPLLTSRLKLS